MKQCIESAAINNVADKICTFSHYYTK